MNGNSSGGESQQGVIYKITCLVTGKPYVGQTRQKFGTRIRQHKCDSKKAKVGIGAAIRKYGWENFSVEVLETCPVEKLNEREMFWIRELNSKSPNGYNLTDGGDTGSKISEESRARMSVAKKGKPSKRKGKTLTEEHKRKISEHHKANGVKPPGWAGRKHTPETIVKIIKSNKRTWAKKKAIENGGNK